MPSKLRLDEFVTFTCDANGNGSSLPIGPRRYGDRWEVTLMSFQTTADPSSEGEFFVYRNAVQPFNQVDYSQKIAGDTSNTNIPIVNGETLIFTVVGAPAGITVSIHVTGDLIGIR